ncbi:MAG: hypothetical protein KFB96_00860 [Thiocapsa sp.]|uniref:hypothetical protein n=1 Tax=Thiocapsa sp. TaxID=2024551 RepID=UPI001BD05A78|nr:hypothetical protein [Thiocapsa sp.]QVL49119.1 MAG: hypothetical protein KFB96_00860 [Thiocapsa sp.]
MLGFNAGLARLIILDQAQVAAEARALAAQRESTGDLLETLDLIETDCVGIRHSGYPKSKGRTQRLTLRCSA